MDIIVTLKSYLNELKEIETAKGTPKPVPTVTELAKAVGINQSSLSKIANNRIGKVDRQLLAKIMATWGTTAFPSVLILSILPGTPLATLPMPGSTAHQLA
jgi:transcriptional regulator with XRE-family HTH domain